MPHHVQSDNEQSLLLSLACGATIEGAARQAGLSEKLVQQRLKNPEFQSRLQDVKHDLVQRTSSMLTAAAVESVKTLLDLQGKSHPPAVRHNAARTIIELGLKLREHL